MHKLRFRHHKDWCQVSEDMLRTCEEALGYQLPADYRSFVLDFGFSLCRGLRFRDAQKPHEEGGGVDWFLGLNPDSLMDLCRQRRGMDQDRIPLEFLEIAVSSGACMICLGIAGAYYGKVYWWNRDEPNDDPYKNLTEVAPDFDSFMNSLYLSED